MSARAKHAGMRRDGRCRHGGGGGGESTRIQEKMSRTHWLTGAVSKKVAAVSISAGSVRRDRRAGFIPGSPPADHSRLLGNGATPHAVLDFRVYLERARFRVSSRRCPQHPFNSLQLPRSTGDVAHRVGKVVVKSDLLGVDRRERKEPVAILHHVLTVETAVTIVLGVIGHAARPYLLDRQSIHYGWISRKRATDFINTHLVSGHVRHITRVLLCVFGIFSRRMEEYALSFLRTRSAD